MKNIFILFVVIIVAKNSLFAQQMPSKIENIAYLVTFGKEASTSFGDDDFFQTFFFQIPKTCTDPIYIRVFDPEVSGKHDEKNDAFNTEMVYSIYGGANCTTDPILKKAKTAEECSSGELLKKRTFRNETDYDDKWVTFGPFNPKEGEFIKHFKAYGFKLIIDGASGDDGNIYKLFLSSKPDRNVPVEGGNVFTYKYHFRLMSERNSVSHLYPYVDNKVVTIRQHNFDFDNDGIIKVISTAKNGQIVKSSGDNVWAENDLTVHRIERNTSLDFQIVKKGAWHNDMVIYLTNQYNEKLPFFSIPIGGIPKYKMEIDIIYHQ